MTDPTLAVELVAFATEAAGFSRVVVVGRSMRPLMRAGMIAEVERLTAKPKVGDIIVFRAANGLVAHRLMSYLGSSGYVTCGDAFPENPEKVGVADVVGRVRAVWSGSDARAQRIDGPLFHALGRLMVWTRSPRAVLRLLRRGSRYVYSSPVHVPAFRAMVGASVSFERGDLQTAMERATAVPPESLIAAAMRHGMAGLFLRWFKAAAEAGLSVPRDLLETFQKLRWFTGMMTPQVISRAQDVSRRFGAAGIDGILLKGGARLCAGNVDADLYWASDVDVLVPAERADEAVAALHAAGYTDRASEAALRFYRERVHHRAPLWPPKGAIPVEVHVTLCIPGSVSAPLDYKALARYAKTVDGAEGRVRVFDDVVAALHLAYHARDFHIWRDIVLLSRYLRRMDSQQRREFDQLVSRERRDSIRLRSAVAAADGLTAEGTLPQPIAAYLSWAIAREDFPLALRKRSSIVEAFFAKSYVYYRGFGHMIGQVHRWIYNVLATPIVLRWAFWSTTTCGEASDLFGPRVRPF